MWFSDSDGYAKSIRDNLMTAALIKVVRFGERWPSTQYHTVHVEINWFCRKQEAGSWRVVVVVPSA